MLGPGSACRASVAVSTIRPCSFSTNETSRVMGFGTTNANRICSTRSEPVRSLATLARRNGRIIIPEKYNPAPVEKHAVDPKQAVRSDKNRGKLDKGLQDTFPASDHLSSSEPSESKPDSDE
jgi:hypothetical protein